MVVVHVQNVPYYTADIVIENNSQLKYAGLFANFLYKMGEPNKFG